MTTTTAPVYLYGDTESDWHDSTCPCERHCRNCGYELTGRQRKYCSDYCGRVWRAEVALDAHLREVLSDAR